MKKLLILAFFLLLIPVVHADQDDCGLLDLPSCLPKKIAEFFVDMLNAPLQPMLTLIEGLFSEPVQIGLFSGLWATMMYIISLFYSLLILYSGFNFMISGHDVAKRENAKQWLKNTLVMIVLVQASYFIYELALELSAGLSAGVINLIPQEIFLLTADSMTSIGLQLVLLLPYVLVLVTTVLILLIRYVIVCMGIVLFPIGIFLYFFDPLKDYGKLILNIVLSNIFVTFFASIILLAASKLIEINFLQDYKILVMTSAFSLVNLAMILIMFFVIVKSTYKAAKPVIKVATTAAKLL